ncbi:GNAT family N-acetyltransferase [Runella sp.]|uniref:GNAT family N-acetyltransferase n=1 Tax=Runella sp. TaxID=1960881 RepID=UPI003D0F8708
MSDQFRLIRLNHDYPIETKVFDCDDHDLNEFLYKDARLYQKQLLAVTYIIEDPETNEILGFFCVLNDKLTSEDFKGIRNRFQRKIPNSKRFNTYPCVKIGRLAVNKRIKKTGVGTQIIDFIKYFFFENNKTGCRFITVDAYAQSTGFYEKKGFLYLTETDISQSTRQMYFDLMQLDK